ncbi:MAG: PKD domain-containing protein, partial [Kiritimatiellae bacterium]|nr:PKD domain-containing protein [Kiritimatiellia bacterium]
MEAGLLEACGIDSCGSNTATTYGGGVYASVGRINRTKFTGCRVYATYGGTSVGYGSALYLSNGAVCENSLFTGNAAVTCTVNRDRGGVVHLTGSGTALVNCSVVKNDLARGKEGNADCNFTGIFQSSEARVVNCVAYLNCPSDVASTIRCDVYGAANCFVNSAWDANSYKAANYGTYKSISSPITIDEKAFAGFESGNYSPASYGSLHNAGSDEDYKQYAVSTIDLAGVSRSEGETIDIGCYEIIESVVTAEVKADSYGVLLGTPARFTVIAVGGSMNYKYRWNFGDGTEDVLTDQAIVSHTYAAAGLYHAFVSVSDDGGTTWPVTPVLKSAIAVAPAHLYVDAASENPTFPYDTPEKSSATLSDALNCLTNTLEETLNMAVVDGVTIHVAKGTYMGVGYALAGDVTIVGEGAAETVFDGKGGYRIFSLMAPGATLKSLCVSNGTFTAQKQQGAGVYMEAGLIEDCRIDSCGNASINTTYGGGVYASGGRINRTKFTGCKVHMTWNYKSWGSALYLCNGAICENSLFTGNAAPSHDLVNPYGYRGG